jgi:hypothetical protein
MKTPRTDAKQTFTPDEGMPWVDADFARQLETELAVSLHEQLRTETELLESHDLLAWLDSEYQIARKRIKQLEEELKK